MLSWEFWVPSEDDQSMALRLVYAALSKLMQWAVWTARDSPAKERCRYFRLHR